MHNRTKPTGKNYRENKPKTVGSIIGIGRRTTYVHTSVAGVVSTLRPLSWRRLECLSSHAGCGQLRMAAERIHKTPTLPAYRLCTAAGANAVTLRGRFHSVGSTRATSRAWQEIAQQPAIPALSKHRAVKPHHTFIPASKVFFVVCMSTLNLEWERDGVAHAPAPPTPNPAQHIPASSTRGLLDSQATLTCCLVLFGWIPL